MSNAIRIHALGGPEVLQWEPYDPGEPGRGEVLIRHTAVGLNFVDVYQRTGLYPAVLPAILGREAAGVIVALGRGVRRWAVGDRVAYVFEHSGAYTQLRRVPANHLVKIPTGVSDQVAAAAMLKGMTARFLLRRTCCVSDGDTVVIHAAAGGVGLIASQWARHLGAIVIGVVGDDAKAAVAQQHGCHHVLIRGRDDVALGVRDITSGKGADVVYDSVGRDTFTESLDCLRPLGLMVSYGNSSGPVLPFAPLELSNRGSLFLTRPTLFHYIATRRELDRTARDLFDVINRGIVRIEIGQTYALQDVAQAHHDLEARRTTGSTILIP